MANKNLQGIKKFKFFNEEKIEDADKNQKFLSYNLNHLTPTTLRIYDKYYYVSGKLKEDKSANKQNLFRIVKVNQSGKLLEEYVPFTDSIIDFDIIKFDNKPYIVAIGTDLKSKEDKSKAEAKINPNKEIRKIIVKPTPDTISCIKIFDMSNPQTEVEQKNEIVDEKKKDKEKDKKKELGILKTNDIIYLFHKKENPGDIFKGNNLSNLPDGYVPISDIPCFSVSPKLNSVSFSYGTYVVEINFELSQKDKPIQTQFFSILSPDKKIITNLRYAIFGVESFLYFTTNDSIYYKKVGDPKANKPSLVGDENLHYGSDPNNFDVNSERSIIFSTSVTYYIEEFNWMGNDYQLLTTKAFERQTRFTKFFKKYYVFVLYQEEKPTLCVYDPQNNIFITLDDYKSKDFLSVIIENERIYLLAVGSEGYKILCLKECDNKDKFDTFYKKNFFDVAYTFGKNLGYEKKKLSEISKLYAEHLYNKNQDYEKSIEQYKLTINYLDPSYVIQKFLDGSKLNYLIEYLEALQNNSEFKNNCNDERLKDFTALLLNCYIKQKQIKKLKEFVEKKNIKDEVTIKTAIEVCKDTNKIDLALSIADKANMIDSLIQILMDIKGDFKESLDRIEKIQEIKKKFELLIAYGEKFLEKKDVIDEAMKVITKLIEEIINIKNKNANDERIKNLNYEKIISIFISKESEEKLEKLLDDIMEKDNDCPKQIILRRIELYVDKYTENKYDSADKIKKILKNEKFKEKLDKNYLLMLFKISGFNQGVTLLSEIMELDQDLLQIYMDQYEYQKINESCKEVMKKNQGKKKKVNYWLQALNYYISISSKSTIGYLGKYIEEVLDHLSESKEEDFSPMILLDILNKARSTHGHIIEFKVIKKYIINWIEKQQESLKNDKKETEDNYKKIEENNKQLKELQMTAKSYSFTRCPICNGALDIPFVYFICGHGYHVNCLNSENNNDEYECSVCKSKMNVYINKLDEGKKLSQDPSSFFKDIAKEDNENKFDVFASYLGKGVFINKNDPENEPKKEENEDNEINEDFN